MKAWQQDDPYEMVKEFTASALSVVSVASTGSIVLSSSMDSHIKAWDLGTGEQVADIDCGPVDTWHLAVSPAEPNLVATTGQSGHINIWNIKEGTKVRTLETPNAKFTMSVAWVRTSPLFALHPCPSSVLPQLINSLTCFYVSFEEYGWKIARLWQYGRND